MGMCYTRVSCASILPD
ncbi:hypothetical protein F383_16749 [Gossypium arboreum]|uniref:Uncharacterized protein n=1 Tax=Gossypium arboreum TaxID=29729 RepID=A0A0B0NLF1_GOSAR|nr:hypothetical protein F383_16749 [Gossypium arboreum]